MVTPEPMTTSLHVWYLSIDNWHDDCREGGRGSANGGGRGGANGGVRGGARSAT